MTAKKLPPVISPQEAVKLKGEENVVIADLRTGAGIKEKYVAKHLAGALFVDLEQELAAHGKDPSEGGRHPLPGIQEFAKVLQQKGISTESRVIIYDDKNGSNAAARFWWMLRSAGHIAAQVIDGGFEAAIAAGFPTATGEEVVVEATGYPVSDWLLPTVYISQVKTAAKDPHAIVIDVRDEKRFLGEVEPIDLIAGHIPGAVNMPFVNNLDKNGFFLTPGELKQKYTEALKDKSLDQVIVHCGSGVTACHTLLAMDYAGLAIPALYVGSWSEWSRNNLPVATNN